MYINILYQNQPLTLKRNMKMSPQSFQLPLPLECSHVKYLWKKYLTPRDYVYKHFVSKSATYIKKKHEKCHRKVFNYPKISPTNGPSKTIFSDMNLWKFSIRSFDFKIKSSQTCALGTWLTFRALKVIKWHFDHKNS